MGNSCGNGGSGGIDANDKNNKAGDVTTLLRRIADGDDAARDVLLEIVYDDLRRIAMRRLGGDRRGTISPTTLVNECFIELWGERPISCADRQHLFALAARAMRNIVIDRARHEAAQKRGGGRTRVSLEQTSLCVTDQYEELLALNDALDRLSKTEPLGTQIVMLRFFAGLTQEETAAALGLPVIRVRREWEYTRALLHREIVGRSDSQEKLPKK